MKNPIEFGHSIESGHEHEPTPLCNVRRAQLYDLAGLYPVLKQSVVNPITGEVITSEITEIIEEVRASIENPGQGVTQFFIAESMKGEVLGMMGLQLPGEVMSSFTETDQPIEIINAHVGSDSRRKGIGRELVKHLEKSAKMDGFKEIIVNSGPRYMSESWKFWTKRYGEPVGIAEKYYDDEWDAMVWQHDL